MAMAQKAKEFDEASDFIECLRDFKLYMAAHLEKEQTQFKQRMSSLPNATTLCINELSNSIHNFYTGLAPNVINEFINLGIHINPQYHFITFNYTDVFDTLSKSIIEFIDNIIHIHGKLDADVVLGVDNLGQITDLPYKPTKRFERAFIKPEFNKSYDKARLTMANAIIDHSDIICIYGMSLGQSDHSWIVRLKNWLLSNQDNHLVYFVHDKTVFNKLNWDAIIDEEEDRIAALLGKLCDSSDEMGKIFSQIHIPVCYDIFGIDEILKSEKIKVDEDNKKKAELRRQLSERPRENGVLMR